MAHRKADPPIAAITSGKKCVISTPGTPTPHHHLEREKKSMNRLLNFFVPKRSCNR